MPSSQPPLASVDALITSLRHPREAEIRFLRGILLGLDASVAEEIKWNAPSFKTCEHFATMQLRAKQGVQLILHFGAKKREPRALEIADPDGLLTWLGPDRAAVSFDGMDALVRQRPALERVLREWIRYV